MEVEAFVARRRALESELGEDWALLLFAGESVRKSADADYPFYANRNFLYLTGIEQAQSALLITRLSGTTRERLYLNMPDEAREIWTGRRLRPQEAAAVSGVGEICDVAGLAREVAGLVGSGRVRTFYLCLDALAPTEPASLERRYAARLQSLYPQIHIGDVYPRLSALRAVKDGHEIAAIRRAMTLTGKGIRAMMAACRPGMMEYQLEAVFDGALKQEGQRFPAFDSIIAAGPRNFYLHYPSPMGRIEDGDLVLTDVGAPFDHYHTDISRVFPANGRFSQRQADIYRVALAANEAVLAAVKPGAPFAQNNEICREVCFEGLRALGLIDDIRDIRRYVWHGVTHYVGLDTHDVGSYEIPMAENMYFCVDAGIYVREWGIGLRVEDDVLVTGNGCELLSRDIPRTIEDIEQAMR